MRTVILDGAALPDRAALHRRLAQALDLPAWYGRNLDALRDYREREVFGNAYRHPRLYKELVKEGVRYPFVRKDARP